MRAVVVYESMYGNTRSVAQAVGDGLAKTLDVDVDVVVVADVGDVSGADLLVLGAPTHAWGMSRPSTRRSAVQAAGKQDSGLTIEPGAAGAGIREWLAGAPGIAARVATFDTRMNAPLGLHGSAAERMARRLRRRGLALLTAPQQFTVTKQNRLLAGELDRARDWGVGVAAALLAAESKPTTSGHHSGGQP